VILTGDEQEQHTAVRVAFGGGGVAAQDQARHARMVMHQDGQ